MKKTYIVDEHKIKNYSTSDVLGVLENSGAGNSVFRLKSFSGSTRLHLLNLNQSEYSVGIDRCDGKLKISTSNDFSSVKLSIDADGNVVVGNDSSTGEKFEVQGNIRVKQNYIKFNDNIVNKVLVSDGTGYAPGWVIWGTISGTLSNQTDLKNALDEKAAAVHNHTGVYAPVSHLHIINDVTGLQSALDNKAPASHDHDTIYSSIGHNHSGVYASFSHTHAIVDVTGLQNALEGKASSSHNHSGIYAAASHSHLINDVTGLQTALDNKASSDHNHDNVYSAIGHNHSGVYAPISHSHAIADVTGLQTTLDSKASTAHNHSGVYAPVSHSHGINDIADLQTALDNKASASHNHDTIYSGIGHSHAGFYEPSFFTLPTSKGGTGCSGGWTNNQFLITSDYGASITASGYSASSFAVEGHNHDDSYSQVGHNHSGVYAPLSHTHAISNITNLQSTLDGKADAGHIHSGVYEPAFSTLPTSKGGTGCTGGWTNNQFLTSSDYGATISSSGYSAASFAAAGHNHSGVYANASHQHAISDITGLSTALAGKSNTDHTHALVPEAEYADESGHANFTTVADAVYNAAKTFSFTASDFAAENHNHSGVYATYSHSHNSLTGNWSGVLYDNNGAQVTVTHGVITNVI